MLKLIRGTQKEISFHFFKLSKHLSLCFELLLLFELWIMLQYLNFVILRAKCESTCSDLCDLPHLIVLLCQDHIDECQLCLLQFVDFISLCDGFDDV